MLRRPRRSGARSRHLSRATLALAGACAVTLAMPLPSPRGEVLDLVGAPGRDAPEVSGGEQAERPAPPSPAAQVQRDERPAGWHAGAPLRRTIAEAEGPLVPPASTLTGYAWPIAHPRLTLPFGPTAWGSRWVNGERFHDGVDLATFCGDRVIAAHAGRVLAAGRRYDHWMGWVGDLGPYFGRLDRKGLWLTLPIVVVIDDGNGYRSVYAHLSRVVVAPGQRVRAGQLLGFEGATGHASGCHLHYSLFSPWERETFAIRRDVVKRMKVPVAEIARIDPLRVLPPKPGINAPRTASPRAAPEAGPTAEASAEPTNRLVTGTRRQLQ